MTYYKAPKGETKLDHILNLKKLRILSLSETEINDLRLLAELKELDVVILRKTTVSAYKMPEKLHFSILTDRDELINSKLQLDNESVVTDSRDRCDLDFLRGLVGNAYSDGQHDLYKETRLVPVFAEDANVEICKVFNGSNDKLTHGYERMVSLYKDIACPTLGESEICSIPMN